MSEPRIFGYSRVSTQDQNPDMQLDALKAAGCQVIFTEKASGARRDRPELEKLLAELQPGDTVITWKLDRLARSLGHLAALLDDWCQRGIVFRTLDGLDSTTVMGRAMCGMAGVFAQVERELIRERVIGGQRAAKRRGRHIGRKPTEVEKLEGAATLAESMGVAAAAKAVGISRYTLWRWMSGRHIQEAGRVVVRVEPGSEQTRTVRVQLQKGQEETRKVVVDVTEEPDETRVVQITGATGEQNKPGAPESTPRQPRP